MTDKRLEKLVNAANAQLPQKEAAQERKYKAEEQAEREMGRSAAERDRGNWSSAIEAQVKTEVYRGKGSLSVRRSADYPQTVGCRLVAYKKNFFGRPVGHSYAMRGLTEVCNLDFRHTALKGYVEALQEMLGTTFRVTGDAGGPREYQESVAGIQHGDGSHSSLYTSRSYSAEPSVSVSW